MYHQLFPTKQYLTKVRRKSLLLTHGPPKLVLKGAEGVRVRVGVKVMDGETTGKG